MILIICLAILFIVVIVIVSKKHQYAVDNISRSNRETGYVETAEEIIRKEKTLKTIRYIICYTFLVALAIFMVLPFYWMLITSVKTQAEIELTTPTFFPKKFTFENYRYILDTKYQLQQLGYDPSIKANMRYIRFDLLRLMYNTILVGVVSTIGTLVTTIMAAFAFSRIKFPGREIIFAIFLATMMIPGEMMVISNYIIVVKYMKGTDHYWAMIIPFLISVYYIYLLRQNFKQIPDELYYAAKVDGTSNIKYLLKVMIPIAMPTIITITILKLMGSWNAYVWPNLVTRDPAMRLISNGLRTGFSDSEGRSAQGRQMAAATAVLFPLLLVFIFLRKYIMRGVSRSGIKG